MKRSAIGSMPTTPGPFTPVIRPRRNTTSLEYSDTTRNGSSAVWLFVVLAIRLSSCGRSAVGPAPQPFDRCDVQREALHVPHHHLGAHRRRPRPVVERGRPHLPTDPGIPRGVERLGDDALLPAQLVGA